MIILLAPHALPQMAIRLPNPVVNDTEENQSTVAQKYKMDGTYSTFLRSNEKRIIKVAFQIQIEKQQEVVEFFKKVAQETIRYVTETGSFVGVLTSSVLVFRAASNKSYEFDLELEGSWM